MENGIMLEPYFRSVLEQDRAAVVLCNLDHTILYINPAAAKRYAKSGGYSLVGQSLFDCHNARSNELIVKAVGWFRENAGRNIVYTFYNEKENKDVYMVALRDDAGELIGYYEKHEYRNRETMKMYDFYSE